MDAFELLKTDHKKVSQLFEEIESASGQAKSQLFKRLKSELDLHAHIEETYLYPALENKKEARDITLEAYEEHKVVKDLLAELANGKAPNDEWDAKLKVLKENVDHHVEEEEGELFDKAEDVLSEEEIERLGEQMEAEKLRKQGDPAQGKREAQAEREAQSENGQKAKRSSARAGDSGPGVLKRLAKLVGLGDSSSKKRKTAKPKGTKSSAARSSRKKSASKAKASKSTKSTSAGASRTKRAGKSSARSTSASKSKGARKAARGRAASKRSSGKKAASRRIGARKSRGR